MIWALRGLRWSYCAFIAWANTQILLGFLGTHAGYDIPALALAGIQWIAILVFLFEKFEVTACIVLVCAYIAAAALATLTGEIPLRYVYYAATAIYIVLARRAYAKAAALATPSL